uniref:galactosylgalactosylxylosylprotein 3-beta-glucuronosyltransferase n=1 Tax=Pectinophora gossypiella TaxID=13191 RepID=A0A1E1WGT9_PECGO
MRFVKDIKSIFIMSLLINAALFIIFWSDVELGLEAVFQRAIKLQVKNKVCDVNLNDDRPYISNKTDLKMIYYVTPTYPRPEQTPELTRLAHTLMHVPSIHWIVADDQPVCSDQVLSILRYV